MIRKIVREWYIYFINFFFHFSFSTHLLYRYFIGETFSCVYFNQKQTKILKDLRQIQRVWIP